LAQAMALKTPSVTSKKSDWGLFGAPEHHSVCGTGGGADVYQDLTYHCAGKSVGLRRPTKGAGTRLLHGDFGRKLSPSEEVLALYITKHSHLFDGRRVLVLGAGLGFAGLVCAVCTEAACVDLTDGDPQVVKTLAESTNMNRSSFGSTEVSVRKLDWGEMRDWPLRASYDVVVAADVVYLESLHQTIISLLSWVCPSGMFLLFASRRNGSLDAFISTAGAQLQPKPCLKVSDAYDEEVSKTMCRTTKCYPIMVKIQLDPHGLTHAVAQTADTSLPPALSPPCRKNERNDQEPAEVCGSKHGIAESLGGSSLQKAVDPGSHSRKSTKLSILPEEAPESSGLLAQVGCSWDPAPGWAPAPGWSPLPLGSRAAFASVTESKYLRGSKCRSTPSLNIAPPRRGSQLDVAFRDLSARFCRSDGFTQGECSPSGAGGLDKFASRSLLSRADQKPSGTLSLYQTKLRKTWTRSQPGLLRLASLTQDGPTRPCPFDKRDLMIKSCDPLGVKKWEDAALAHI